MKKLFSLLFVFLPSLLIAQNVGINNDASQPDNTAILDIKSNSKGLLIPRMTSAERTAIAAPAIGLTVFDTETVSYWMFRGDLFGNWAELQHNYQNFWTNSGTDVYNKNAGNIGIGTNNPTEKLSLNAPNATMQFMNSGTARGYLQVNGTDMRLGTYVNNTTGNIIFNTRAVDRMWINEDGQVGIGTSTPSTALTVNGANPVLQLRNADVNKGFVLLNGDDLRVGTNSTNTTGSLVLQTKLVDRMIIDENGQIGIGTSTPTSILSINSANPILQLKNSGVDKGFIQLVNDDIKIGTNSANANGKFIVRTDATDRAWFHNDGKVSLGTVSTNGAQLSIGNDFATAGINFFNDNTNTFNISSWAGNAWVETFTDQLILRSGSGASLYLKNNGQATIGLVSPAVNYRLTVLGKIMCADVTTSPVYNWPDYVFADTYKLKPLSEVKKFIEENKHLYGIPSAAQIEKEGIQLGDMSKRLMEKVEELTLYIIQLQEQVDELKKQIPAKNGK